MKKFLLLALAFFLFTGITLPKEVPDSSKTPLSERIYNDTKAAISQIGKALSVGAEHVYEVLVKQQYVKSVTNLLIYLLIVPILVFFVYSWKGVAKDRKGGFSVDDHWIGCSIASTALLVIWTAFLIGSLEGTITGFFNPEYGAIEKIMELIR